MKKPIVITLRTIHCGVARRVVTLDLGKGSPADEFLQALHKSNRDGFDALRARIQNIAKYPKKSCNYTFKHLGNGLYEFKTKKSGLRLYAFYDDAIFDEEDRPLIIASTGSGKGTAQKKAINEAHGIKNEYFEAKEIESTTINLIKADDEN